MTIPIGSVPVAVGFAIHAISMLWDESRVLDFLIHALLERLVKTGAFPRDVVDIADFRLHAESRLRR